MSNRWSVVRFMHNFLRGSGCWHCNRPFFQQRRFWNRVKEGGWNTASTTFTQTPCRHLGWFPVRGSDAPPLLWQVIGFVWDSNPSFVSCYDIRFFRVNKHCANVEGPESKHLSREEFPSAERPVAVVGSCIGKVKWKRALKNETCGGPFIENLNTCLSDVECNLPGDEWDKCAAPAALPVLCGL